MNETFDGLYAEIYDALYRDKDYAAEAELVHGVIGDARSVLDVACGSGRHARELARRGLAVHGIDLSPDLINEARSMNHGSTTFEVADMRDFTLGLRFDAAICMYAALGYATSLRDVFATLDCVWRHVRPGSPFLLDVWNAAAVRADPPKTMELRVALPGGRTLLRTTSPVLDMLRQTCRLRYDLCLFDRWERVVDRQAYEHTIRFFDRDELERLLDAAGFRVEHAYAFPDLDVAPGPERWYLGLIARAVD